MKIAHFSLTRDDMMAAWTKYLNDAIRSDKTFTSRRSTMSIELGDNEIFFFNAEEMFRVRGFRFDGAVVPKELSHPIVNSVIRPALIESQGKIIVQ